MIPSADRRRARQKFRAFGADRFRRWGGASLALNQVSGFSENLTERPGGGPGPVGRTARGAELMQITRIRIIKYAVYVAIGHPVTSTEQCNKRINYYLPNESSTEPRKRRFLWRTFPLQISRQVTTFNPTTVLSPAPNELAHLTLSLIHPPENHKIL